MTPQKLISSLSPPIDSTLASQLVAEFLDVERRYVLRDWEPATLNGGQFAEIASRIIYHTDSGNLNLRKSVNDCLRYIEDENNSNSHSFPERRSSLHLCKVLRTLYKFRSQRGAVHIDPDYTSNEVDSQLVVSLVRWTMAEILRLFWSSDRAEVVRAIKEIVRYEVPAVLTVDGRYLIQRTDLTIQEELLLLLHNVGEAGMTSTELVNSTPRADSSIRSQISKLASARFREIIKREDDRYVLTDQGVKRVREQLAEKLTI